MKKLMSIALFFLAVLTQAQVEGQTEMKKNTISFQTGIWQSGLAGGSYHRHFPINSYMSTSVGVSAGIGIGWQSGGWFGSIERNVFAGGDISLNLGPEQVKFMLGVQPKYVDLHARDHFEGFATLPYIGVSSGFSTITLQFKAGALVYGEQLDQMLPSASLSIGCSF